MPRFTIDLTDKALARLQTIITETNEQTGQSLTVKQWIDLHLREVAIQRELSSTAQAVSQAAVAAERDRLLADITA